MVWYVDDAQLRALPKWEEGAPATAAPKDQLYIVERRLCIVHRKINCIAARNLARITVSRNQCLVYKLPSCHTCWPDIREYERMVHGAAEKQMTIG